MTKTGGSSNRDWSSNRDDSEVGDLDKGSSHPATSASIEMKSGRGGSIGASSGYNLGFGSWGGVGLKSQAASERPAVLKTLVGNDQGNW